MAKEKNNLASYYFHQGTNYNAFDYLGVHKDSDTYIFRTWAPNAAKVFLVGDFNNWSEQNEMFLIDNSGIYETTVSNNIFGEGSLYKFKIIAKDGRELYKADPYAFGTELPPQTASIYRNIEHFEWHDSSWFKYRAETMTKENRMSQPINIYEMHFGSWKLHEDGSFYSYIEMSDELIPYIKQMGYTHIELMPIMEHPFDGSWGYQVCSYYAPTSRYGTPTEFMTFVDRLHTAGIGIILDWVPAHFPKDAHGLYEFDGQPLYEYQGVDRMEHKGWGTRKFDLGRNEVECFLISNALFWLKKYHIDGLRVDAVSSMLYLDFDKQPGEWIPNVYGDNRCLEAIAFFQKLNSCIINEFPDVLMIAEESSAWPNVTSFDDGGLGFSMKWNMGWMNDSLDYFQKDPIFRKFAHNALTFPMMYIYSEKYINAISHDEVVHGKKSLLDKMPGIYEEKFAGLRSFLGYMMTMPGKKLSFMGYEIGQFREWDYKGQIEWFLLQYDKHRETQLYVADLNRFYLQNKPLYENDSNWEGFKWIEADNADMSMISFIRTDLSGNSLYIFLNLTPVNRVDYEFKLDKGKYKEVFNSDSTKYGGSNILNLGTIKTELKDDDNIIKLNLPPLSVVILKKI